MAANLQASGQTNPQPNTCVDAQCDCNVIWSLAQQFAMRQISNHVRADHGIPDYRDNEHYVSGAQVENARPEFVSNYAVRARRIASAYARMYLEEFHLGQKDKIGRFYWLGLGAFAAKQVAVTLELKRVRIARWSALYEGLGDGNLWLFNDVLPWHYGYAAGAAAFSECVAARDSRQFVDAVGRNLSNQKGFEKSVDKVPYEIDGETGVKKQKLGYLRATPLVVEGFAKVADWETASPYKRPGIALDHLLCIAKHEQGEVLQGLIYDDQNFAWWLNRQHDGLAASDDTSFNDRMESSRYFPSDGSDLAGMALIRALVPNLQLVLTSDDTTDDPDFLSVAPDRTILQDYQQRMSWIQAVANKYHRLMRGRRKDRLRDELEKIAEWGNLIDK
ncbi:DUF2515 family protein [Paraburkholderia xenovorans]|uniref:DUF2515 family protein n=1 Tax=Paraburkholderia xenovorans TaxID=36873 RepID=UPI0038BDAB82